MPLNAAAEVAVKHGIRIGYHNHWFELESVIDGVYRTEILQLGLQPGG
jgi:hypothetical protein